MSQQKKSKKVAGSSVGSRKQNPGTSTVNKSAVNKRQTRWGIITSVAVVLIAVVVIISVVLLRGHSTTQAVQGLASASPQIIPSALTGAPTAQLQPKQVANTTGVPGVLAWDTTGWPGNGNTYPGALEHQHVPGPVSYAVVPPVGGPHNAIWMNAGVYTKPVPTERALHNLEHGAVWITYDPNLPPAQIAALTQFVGRQSMIAESAQASGVADQANRYLDLSPWATNTLPSPIVLSSWGYQLRVSSPADPRLQQFVNTFRNSTKYSPEYGSAVDGIPIQTGGRPALDGSKQPNPPGSA